jgi:hypothetical protein
MINYIIYGNETRVLDPRSKLLRSHMPDPATHSQILNKEAWWRQSRFITLLRTCHGKRESKHSTHLQSSSGVQKWIIGLNKQKDEGQGTKVWIAKQFSHRCEVVGHYLSPCSGRASEVVIWSNAGGPSKGKSAVGCSFYPLSWRYYLPFLKSKVIAKWL